MENIDLNLHSVILYVGPTNSGKTYLTKTKLVPELTALLSENGVKPNVHHLSSDDVRRDLLSDSTLSKYDVDMMSVSDRAFNLLHHKLDLLMQWPNNAHFVVVDTTGLNDAFRSKIVAQAKAANYSVAVMVFDYKDSAEYLKYVNEEHSDKKLLFKHLKRLRTNVWKTISRDTYDQIFRIKSKAFESLTFSIKGLEKYASCHKHGYLRYDIVGDIHGCYDEFVKLLIQNNYQVEGSKITPPVGHGLVLVGDLIDKGPSSKEVLDLVVANLDQPWLKVVDGNHENFVRKYLSKDLTSGGISEKLRLKYFDSTEKYANDSDFLNNLNTLRDKALPFFATKRMIVTHAPCESKYLGKIDRHSIKNQRGQFRGPSKLDYDNLAAYQADVTKFYSYLSNESSFSLPLRVFGHVSTEYATLNKNIVGVDTGCSSGNRLTMASINHANRVFFSSVQSSMPRNEDFLVNLGKKAFGDPDTEIDLSALDPRDYNRIIRAAENKINYISGTIPPADADVQNGVLESFDKALEYYQNAGITGLSIEPKYMGSRCNVYLSKNLDECYAVSRNGFKIRHLDLKSVFKELQDKHQGLLFKAAYLVLDGELLPWSALGSGLIDEHYKVVEYGLETEFNILNESGFYELFDAAKAQSALGFDQLVSNTPKDEMIKQFGQAKYRTFNNIRGLSFRSHEDVMADINTYKEQIRLFGASGEPAFKAFSILKVVNTDDEIIWRSNSFKLVNDEESYVMPDYSESSKEDARHFFNKVITEKQMEGVVIKPLHPNPEYAPAIKVRSPNYLSLVYGYDYRTPAKYKKLLETKRTFKKIKTSVQEAKIGAKLLQVKHSEISKDNNEYCQLVALMVAAEKEEKGLDPRL